MIAAATIYDAYAHVYDAIGQGHFGTYLARWALTWLKDRGLQITHVLDLACGTGAAALAFAEAGCRVVGVDRSPAMLSIAQGRARDAGLSIAFAEGDIRALRIGNEALRSSLLASSNASDHAAFSIQPCTFDLVACFADSLNYLIEDGDLELVFIGAAAALVSGGHLIFDLNSPAEYLTWDERDIITHDSRDYLVYNQLDYDAEASLATGRIVWFVRETELWWRGEETHTQRAWSDAEVCAALAGAGLELVGRFDPSGAELTKSLADARRIVYVARKEHGLPE